MRCIVDARANTGIDPYFFSALTRLFYEWKMVKELQRKYPRTNIFILDSELWAWAQYQAKLKGFKSVSEYLFELIKQDKEKE